MENIIVWGTGTFGASKFYISLLETEYQILGYCDSDRQKWGQDINGYPVLTKEELINISKKKLDRILITVADESVFEQIKESIGEIHLPDHVKVSWFKGIYFSLVEKKMDELRPTKEYKSENIDFRKQSGIWLDNIMSEVAFWTDIVAKPNARNRLNYEKRLQNEKFTSDLTQNTERVEEYLKDKEDAFVYDIGCGLAPRFGTRLASGNEIQLIGVDPLAYFYNEINKRFAKMKCRDIEFGMFEFVSKFIDRKADVVIINNALDHGIDPFRSIVECLCIVKVGGLLHLNHGRTEGLVGMYQGLHQWNLDYDRNGNFTIWNYDVMINVSERLKDVAEIQVYYPEKKQPLNEQFVCVEIIKKKEFSLESILNIENDEAELAFLVKKMMEIISNPAFNIVFKKMLECY